MVHTGLTNSQYINLNSSNGVQTSSNLWGTNATVATDSVFRTGSAGNTGVDGGTTDRHIAYLFATVAGISKVGTFNRPSSVVQNVDCGFSNGARFVVLKRTTQQATGLFGILCEALLQETIPTFL